MSSRAWAIAGISLACAQVARADCIPLTENDVRTIAKASADALLSDDTTTHRHGWLEFLERFPCMQGQLPKEAWASLLVSEAIVRNALGENWLEPLDTAVGAWPEVPGIPDFLRDQYVAGDPTPPLPHRLVRPGATLFVDGVLVAAPPRLTGLHAVQLLDAGTWTDRILHDEPIPADWLVSDEAPVAPADTALHGRGSFSLLVGLGTVTQSVADSGTYFGDAAQTGVLTGVTLIGVEPVPGLHGFAVGWDLRGGAQVASLATSASGERTFSADPLPLPDLYGTIGWMGRGFAVEAGGGASRLWVTTADGLTPYFYPQPPAALEIFGKRADFAFGGGATPSAAHLRIHGGSAVSSHRGLGLRLGVDASTMVAWFEEVAPGTRTASVVSFGLGGTLGIAWDLGD
jgi:hypothetical protein